VTIVVAGARSGVGKTATAVALLKVLKGFSALKTTVAHKGTCKSSQKLRRSGCGICYTLDRPFVLIKEMNSVEERGKDTHRLKEAGAKEVFWLIAKEESLGEGIRYALAQFKRCRGVLIEGTSVLKHLDPDLAIFVKGAGTKPSAKEVLSKVDIFVEPRMV